MSSDHPPPRLRITLKPPERKRKAPDPKVDEADREFDRLVAHTRELPARTPPAPPQEPRLREAWQQLPRPLERHILLQVSRYAPSPLLRTPRGYDDLPHLIDIARRVLQGIKPRIAVTEIANRIGGDSRQRQANWKRLREAYRKDAPIWRRIAQAPNMEAGIDEILEEVERGRDPLSGFTGLKETDYQDFIGFAETDY